MKSKSKKERFTIVNKDPLKNKEKANLMIDDFPPYPKPYTKTQS